MSNHQNYPPDHCYDIWFQIRKRDVYTGSEEDVTPDDLQDPCSFLCDFATYDDAERTVENLMDISSALEQLIREDDWPDQDRVICQIRRSDLLADTNLSSEEVNSLTDDDIDILVGIMQDLYKEGTYSQHLKRAVSEVLESRRRAADNDREPSFS